MFLAFRICARLISSKKGKDIFLWCSALKVSGRWRNNADSVLPKLFSGGKDLAKPRLIWISQAEEEGSGEESSACSIRFVLAKFGADYFLFDIKTAKPNAGGFKEFKRTLLEWVAVVLANKPDAKINTFIAIPYNPYEPEPYTRWTMRGMLDLENELKVADEFWDFLGGKNTYKDLLDCFERVGIELRDEIDAYFKRFNKK